eukprot:CAMPEP_0116880698 /NCGR_PEP_ID=MMETSP0463-20121206/12638_1 /TAXON_ID=181622 /ORGANISM="Strombidinopsis sp, Strain SopsisLIS2011" /LENGTH=120 /DNA_ID=CAMNT_0004531559 /DNA_START=654 /DNA_END=1016 /DNA_ORIENTATION=-
MSKSNTFIWRDTSIYVWLLVLAAGFCQVLCWHLKLMGYRYDKVSRLSPIFYLESAYSFLYDLLIYNVDFSSYAIAGIALILVFFISKIIITLYLPPDEGEKSLKSDPQVVEDDNDDVGTD